MAFKMLVALVVTASLLTLNLENPTAFGQSMAPRLNVEVTILNVTAETEKRIRSLVRNESPRQDVIETVTVETQPIDVHGQPKTATESRTVVYRAPTNSTQISKSRVQQILGLVNASKNCTASTSLKTIAPENQVAIKFAGTARPFYVSSETKPGKFGSPVDVPVYQVIEDGVIVNHKGHVTDNGIKLNSKIVINKLTELNTFTFTGTSNPITIELPTCQAWQLDFNIELEKGKLLLVESNYEKNKVEMTSASSAGSAFASNIPYVNRLFKNAHEPRIYKGKILFIISATTNPIAE